LPRPVGDRIAMVSDPKIAAPRQEVAPTDRIGPLRSAHSRRRGRTLAYRPALSSVSLVPLPLAGLLRRDALGARREPPLLHAVLAAAQPAAKSGPQAVPTAARHRMARTESPRDAGVNSRTTCSRAKLLSRKSTMPPLQLRPKEARATGSISLPRSWPRPVIPASSMARCCTYLMVEICKLGATSCTGPLIATFNADSKRGAERGG
jgi:hypothetical protein